ncbi:MAG: hypothetical protein KJ747_06335 [Actinobacteria bacterium]|nr:hypothetical protein [Actinomycetota bacterium]MCG2807918.1 hypothetical protein [Coriobacteriia bacterium]
MRPSLRHFFVAVMFVVASLSATSAVAAPVTWASVDVTMLSEQAEGVLLLTAHLPETATLPAQAELSVPKGSQIQWIGEIMGGAPDGDLELQTTMTTVGESDTYTFTLTSSRIAQIEILASDMMSFDGTTYASSIRWVPSQDVPQVRMAIRVPQTASITTQDPDAGLQPGDGSFAYYSKTIDGAKAGDELALAVAYTVPAAAAAPAAASSSTGLLAFAIPIVVVVGFVLIVASAMKRKKTAVDDDSAEETDDDSANDAASRPTAGDAVDEDDAARSGVAKRNMVTAVIVAVIVIIAIVAGIQTAKPQQVGDTITQTFNPGEACATANIQLTVPADSDPQATADSLFTALGTVEGLNTVTYNQKSSSLSVGYCESETTEILVREALATTGLLAPGTAPVSPTP